MKKITVVLMVAILMMTFLTGCGKDRLLYKNVNLEKYVDLDGYMGVEVDTKSEEFANIYNSFFSEDIKSYGLFNELKEGTVKNGDIINLDYEGKIDGVAFGGGTAKGSSLEIGSHTFIDDFEEQLIGVAVGATKDVVVTFPTPYQSNPDLAGKEAVFTCKINCIKIPMTVEEAYGKMNFESVDAYKQDLNARAAKSYISEYVCQKAKIIDYPKKDRELLGDEIYEFYIEDYKKAYGVDFEQLLIYSGEDIDEFKKDKSTAVMNVNMVMYYILDAEKLEILESTLNSQGISQKAIAESYAVQDIVIEYLYDNAKIK